jgi:hypothetical protein
MNARLRSFAMLVACALAVAACSGVHTLPSAPAPQKVAKVRAAHVTIRVVFPKRHRHRKLRRRDPHYISASTQSVTFALTKVNGGAIPAGFVPSETITLNPGSSSSNCTYNAGPQTYTCSATWSVPAANDPGDAFTVTAYDGANNALSTASVTQAITPGNNAIGVTLDGVAASFAITPPSGTAGTPFSSQSFTVAAEDADANVILGTYSTPVTVADADAANATAIASTSGSDSPPPGELLSSTDIVTLSYTGLAIAPTAATISASASGATTGTANFAPALQPIVYSGPFNGTAPQMTLTSMVRGGPISASEVGWTNAPYNKVLAASASSGCGPIGTIAPSTGTAFTIELVSQATAGSCTITLSDFAGGNTTPIGLSFVAPNNLYLVNQSSGAISPVSGINEAFAVNGSLPTPFPGLINLYPIAANAITPGLAVDGAGNAYFSEGPLLQEILAVNGSIPASPTVETLATLTGAIGGIAVDGSGDVYVTNSANGEVNEVEAVNGVIPASPTIITLGSVSGALRGVAVDGSGNVYVPSNASNSAGITELSRGIGCSPVCTTALGKTGLTHHTWSSVAVDGSGNIYVSGSDFDIMVLTPGCVSEPSCGFIGAYGGDIDNVVGIALDESRDVFLDDISFVRVSELVAVGGSISPTSTLINIVAISAHGGMAMR